MKFLIMILVGMVTTLGAGPINTANAQERMRPNAEGLPLPWPFPWAKECPVNWKTMEGRYLLSDSSTAEQIDLKITVMSTHGFRLVRMARYSRNGELVADGFNFVSMNQRMLRIRLEPRTRTEPPIWALIKLHYSDWNLGCAEDHLVPILSLEKVNSSNKTTNHYRLVRIVPD